MKSLWSDREASRLSGMALLVYRSRLLGANTALCVWGGGNTSSKFSEKDFRGRTVDVLRVKGSGSDLKTIRAKDFAGVRLDDVLPLLNREAMTDEEMVAFLANCLMEANAPRPSIETLLHAFLPFPHIDHTHADAILSLTNTPSPRRVVREALGDRAVFVPYRRPGFALSKEVAQTVMGGTRVQAVVLEKHGLITWGQTHKESYLRTVAFVSRAERYAARKGTGYFLARKRPAKSSLSPFSAVERRTAACELAPLLRGLISARKPALLHFDDAPDVLEFLASRGAEKLSQIGPATPDHLMSTKRLPLFLEEPPRPLSRSYEAQVSRRMTDYARRYKATYEKYSSGKEPMLDPFPRVILVRGVGLFGTGKDLLRAKIAAEIYHHTIAVMRGACAIGRYESLSEKDAFDVEYWPLELYKLTLAPPEKEMARRVALITGAASGIGRAVAERFLKEGAHVAMGDIDEKSILALGKELGGRFGTEKVLAFGMDVSKEWSVRVAFQKTALAFGGLDVVVSNAGVASCAPVEETRLSDWERAFAVNATGHFLVAREALRILQRQNLGGSLVFVASKNVLAPGKDFGAYSASKAAEAQLAKILAIENGPRRIRVNCIHPDGVFRDSKLWSMELRRERAKAHGIKPGELQEYYRKRNLMAVPVLPEDVAEAALFFAGSRSAKTTGSCLTVDGGVKEAFPR